MLLIETRITKDAFYLWHLAIKNNAVHADDYAVDPGGTITTNTSSDNFASKIFSIEDKIDCFLEP